jgi:hypothetical protein
MLVHCSIPIPFPNRRNEPLALTSSMACFTSPMVIPLEWLEWEWYEEFPNLDANVHFTGSGLCENGIMDFLDLYLENDWASIRSSFDFGFEMLLDQRFRQRWL